MIVLVVLGWVLVGLLVLFVLALLLPAAIRVRFL